MEHHPLSGDILGRHLLALFGSAMAALAVSIVLWLVGFVLVELNREPLGMVVAVLYAPFASVAVVALLAWASGYRLAPALGLMILYPARAMVLFGLEGDVAVALAAQGPLAVVEWGLGVVAVLLAASPLAAIERPSPESGAEGWLRTLAPLAMSFVGTAVLVGVLSVFGWGLVEIELHELLEDVTHIDEGAWIPVIGLFLYGIAFAGLLAASVPRGALPGAWLGAVSGALVVGVVAMAVYDGRRPLMLLWAGVPAMAAGVLALPPVISGSIVRWLWRLSAVDLEEPAEPV
ncbi:MAG: hypothetical protein EP330_24905 [Deltaproteobacteria bacterium]|nr:MAG: hypothetical protein EP330_24905 [Deltaproteobacteria bacterium]